MITEKDLSLEMRIFINHISAIRAVDPEKAMRILGSALNQASPAATKARVRIEASGFKYKIIKV